MSVKENQNENYCIVGSIVYVTTFGYRTKNVQYDLIKDTTERFIFSTDCVNFPE